MIFFFSFKDSMIEKRIRDSSSDQKDMRKENGLPFLINNLVVSLQLLEIKLQTGSFIPRCVQLILHLNFKGVAVSFCRA